MVVISSALVGLPHHETRISTQQATGTCPSCHPKIGSWWLHLQGWLSTRAFIGLPSTSIVMYDRFWLAMHSVLLLVVGPNCRPLFISFSVWQIRELQQPLLFSPPGPGLQVYIPCYDHLSGLVSVVSRLVGLQVDSLQMRLDLMASQHSFLQQKRRSLTIAGPFTCTCLRKPRDTYVTSGIVNECSNFLFSKKKKSKGLLDWCFKEIASPTCSHFLEKRPVSSPVMNSRSLWHGPGSRACTMTLPSLWRKARGSWSCHPLQTTSSLHERTHRRWSKLVDWRRFCEINWALQVRTAVERPLTESSFAGIPAAAVSVDSALIPAGSSFPESLLMPVSHLHRGRDPLVPLAKSEPGTLSSWLSSWQHFILTSPLDWSWPLPLRTLWPQAYLLTLAVALDLHHPPHSIQRLSILQ